MGTRTAAAGPGPAPSRRGPALRRRRLLTLPVLAAALVATVVPASAQGENLVVRGPESAAVFTSPNVTWVGHLPIESPSVSGRVVHVGEQIRFYTTGAKGLSIYDVTEPAEPALLGRLSLPHLQNEDVSVSADGSRVVIGADGALLVPLTLGTGVHVIDTSDPTNPRKVGFLNSSEHTTSCADPACDWLYGASGATYDLRDGGAPRKLAIGWQAHVAADVRLTQKAHDLSRDAAGYVHVDSVPRVMLDPRQDPSAPTVVVSGLVPGSKKLAYQHNSERPRADQWTAREEGDDATALRPGELLIANGETNLVPRCNGGGGPIATWSLRNFDRGEPMEVLETFRPMANGTYNDGNPAVNALGCSGHYFDERNGLLAAAWFEHGTRFIEVDPATGGLKEVGYFQPVSGSAGASYWIDDEYVYVTDYTRGIDILRFDRDEAPASESDLAQSWQRAAQAPRSALADMERYLCSAGTA